MHLPPLIGPLPPPAHPAHLQGMDIYSNILYVKEEFAALSALAHRVAASDKYRPEACCVVGNYYSLRGQHERAVQYFRRALRLNPAYLAAWTLMGHEYVELKNPPAAIGGCGGRRVNVGSDGWGWGGGARRAGGELWFGGAECLGHRGAQLCGSVVAHPTSFPPSR